MRIQPAFVPALLALIFVADLAVAQQGAAPIPDAAAQPAPATAAPPAATETSPTVPADPVSQALATRLANLKQRGVPGDERAWADQLVAVYAERSLKPIWVSEKGLLPHALRAIEEIRRADDWGLDAKAFSLPDNPGAAAEPERLANSEIKLSAAVLTYAKHARGGRVDPSQLSLWLDQKPRPVDARQVLWSLATSEDTADTLRKLHPRHPQFAALRAAYLKTRGQTPEPAAVPPITIPPGPLVQPGGSHPHIALVRQRLNVPAEADDAEKYDAKLEAAVRAYMLETTGRRLGSIGKEVRAALNLSQKPKEPAAATVRRRLLVNMERWRWLPDDLGRVHVWNNLPEFETRFVKAGKIIHQERIIIGKADTQTPVFSDRIRYVVFRPEWGLPPSLKVKDLLPKLQGGDYSVLERRGMRIAGSKKWIDPESIDWSTVDIRKVPIVQEAGDKNPLGDMKFMFPNKHDVYMHDTPAKNLFTSGSRMHSSGCIRVRNPKRFAELLFEEAGGLSATDVRSKLSGSADDNEKADLERAIPVHNTYFTATVEEDGTIKTFSDVYGHDKRIASVLLDGRSVSEVAAEDPAQQLKDKVDELATSGGFSSEAPRRTREVARNGYWNQPPPQQYRRSYYQSRPPKDFFSTLFGN